MQEWLPEFKSLRDNLWASLIWWLLAAIVTFVIGVLVWARTRGRRKYYLPLVLTDSESYSKQVESQAKAYFSKQGCFGKTSMPRVAMESHKSSRIGLVDETVWREMLVDTVKTFRKAEEVPEEELHIVFGTVGMWNLALGSLLKNNHHRHVLYHRQNGTYNRIWQINRFDIKDRKSPTPGRSFLYEFFMKELVSPHGSGDPSSTPKECFVFEIGTHGIIDDVRPFRDQHLPDALIRRFTKKIPSLSPDQPLLWVQAATEIAHALTESRDSNAQDRYVFFDGPAVLMFMAGDAIGDYSQRLHLMQLVKASEGGNGKTYREMLCLPDKQLSEAAG